MSKKGTRALASATLMSLVLTTALSAGPVQASAGQVTRTSGLDRYATAASVATANWTTSDNVVLVNGENYPDAVSASALAKKLNAPILLTKAGDLNADAKAAIAKLGAKNIYVVGGNASVSAAVRTELKANYSLVELGGQNRYETNVAVAKKLVELGVKADNVLLVGGEGFSDALSVAPVAAAKGQILLLGNNNDDSMKSVVEFVKANSSKVTVVGTSNVISDAMYNTLGAVERVNGGANRFETNMNVLNKFAADLKADKLFVANASGNGFADALVASALAGKTASPLVLVDAEGTDATTKAVDYIKTKATKTTDLNVIGGVGVVADSTVTAINDAVNPVVTPGTGNATVASITNVGLGQIKVVFDTEVDEDTAENEAYYQLDGVDLNLADVNARATLQSDKRTVLITLGTPYAQYKDVTVTVKDSILDKDLNNTIPRFEQEITFADTTVPALESVTVSGNNKLTVKFSEPIRMTLANATDFKINGQSISNFGYDQLNSTLENADGLGAWSDKVELYFSTPLPTGSNTFKVPDGVSAGKFSSAANFTLKETTSTFSVDTVTDKPTVSTVEGDTNGKIVVTFNRSMDKVTALTAGNYTVNTHALTGVYAPSSIKFVDGSNDTQVEIKGVSSAVNKGGNTVSISNKIKDAYGNKVEDDTNVNFTAADDDTKPTVTSVNVIDSQTVRVKFSKDVAFAYATNKANYKLVDSTGSDVSSKITVGTTTITATNGGNSATDTYDIKFAKADALTESKYTLTIKNIVDTATTPNAMDEYTTTIAGKDDVAPTVTSVVQKSGDLHKVVVFFSEAMDEASIKDASNFYFINGKGDNKDLPSSATITPAGDDKSVTIEFPSSYVLGAGVNDTNVVQIGIANVKDQAGNVLSGIATTQAISTNYAAGGPSFKADTAKLYYDGDDVKAEVELSAALDTLNINDFTVAGQPADSGSISGKKVILTFKDGVNNNAKINAIKNAGIAATIATIAVPISTDASGRILTANAVGQQVYYYQLAPKTVAASWTATNNDAANNGDDTVTIALDEAVDQGVVSNYENDFVFTTGGSKLDVTGVTFNGNSVVYHFAAGSFGAQAKINVYADSAKIDLRTNKDQDDAYTVYAPSSDDLKVRVVTEGVVGAN